MEPSVSELVQWAKSRWPNKLKNRRAKNDHKTKKIISVISTWYITTYKFRGSESPHMTHQFILNFFTFSINKS